MRLHESPEQFGHATFFRQALPVCEFLAAHEGIFCEPASAAGVAGVLAHGAGDAEKIVCVLTGHGLKDPDTALESASRPTTVPPRVDAVLAQLGL